MLTRGSGCIVIEKREGRAVVGGRHRGEERGGAPCVVIIEEREKEVSVVDGRVAVVILSRIVVVPMKTNK